MKKWLFSLLLLSFIPLVNALDTPSKTIALAPGWNVVSTPANLLDLTFSNGGEGITFTTLKNGSWQSVAATVKNIKPLDGFLVFNANSSTVNLYLWYKYNQSPTESVVQKTLDYGWNLLGITTTSNPFNNIGSSATMTMDLTENTTNKLSSEYEVNVDGSTIANPELGEAYFVYVNQKDKLYGGTSNLGYTVVNDPVIVEPEDDPVIVEPEPDPEEPIVGEEEAVLFDLNQKEKKLVYEGTYVATNSDIMLNTALIIGDKELQGGDIVYHIYINNCQIASINYQINTNNKTYEQLSFEKGYGLSNPIFISKGNSASIKVFAEVDTSISNTYQSKLIFDGENNDGDEAGFFIDDISNIKII